jgi:hypothetical protein
MKRAYIYNHTIFSFNGVLTVLNRPKQQRQSDILNNADQSNYALAGGLIKFACRAPRQPVIVRQRKPIQP